MSSKCRVDPSSKLCFFPFIRVQRRWRDVQEETDQLRRERRPRRDDEQITKPTLLDVLTVESERGDEQGQREQLRNQSETRSDDQLSILVQNTADEKKIIPTARRLCLFGSTSVDLVLHHRRTDQDGRTQIDQEGHDRVQSGDEQMHSCPHRSTRLGKGEDAHRSMSDIVDDRQRLVEEQFIGTADENDERGEQKETTSDARLFQPLPIEHQSHVDTLDGDQRREPEDQSTGGDEEIVEEFAEQSVER